MKKDILYLFLGILTGILIIPGVLQWLGIPSYDKFLQMFLGEPNALKRILAIFITFAFIFIIFKLPSFIRKST